MKYLLKLLDSIVGKFRVIEKDDKDYQKVKEGRLKGKHNIK